MADDLISRRRWVVAAGLAGLGAATTPADANNAVRSELSGPYVDVTTPRGALVTRARLTGNLDPSGRRFDWFDGRVMAVGIAGSVTPLMSVRGHIETRLDAAGAESWRMRRSLFATYYDAASLKPLSEFHNPLTGARVKVSHIDGAAAESVLDATAVGQWRQTGANFELQHSVEADFGALTGLSVTTHTGSLADLQNAALTTLPDSGSWTLVTAWLPWLKMGSTPGHCVFQCTRGGGPELPAQASV